jgi:presenilin-like A22 family membrane protease
MQKTLLLQLAIIFLASQVLGLFVADALIVENVSVTLASDDINDVNNSLFLFGEIILVTIIFLAILKFTKGDLLLQILEALAIFGSSLIVFLAILPDLALLFALLLLTMKKLIPESLLMKNIVSTIAVAGVGALIGVSLGIYPVLIFLILLAVYDLVAVFFTKHMITLAKPIVKKNLAFTVAMPTSKHTYQLGTGDLVIPLAFAVSLLKNAKLSGIGFPAYIWPIGVVLFASVLGLILTLEIAERKQRALPALPLQVLFMVITWLGYNYLVPIA